MKLLTAFVTALTLVGLGGAAFACEDMYKRTTADGAETGQPLIPPSDKTT